MTCCPDADRLHGALTRNGTPVSDLHMHTNRMWRGFVGDSDRATYWFPNGRMTPLAETDWDLEGMP